MDVIFDSPTAQFFVVFFITLFSISAFFWPRFTTLFFPIILPFYLIKAKLSIAGIVLPINLLDVLAAIFLIINWRLIIKGVWSFCHPEQAERSASASRRIYFIVSITLIFFASIFSTIFAIDHKAALGATKSWIWLPVLFFFALLPFLHSVKYRIKFLYSIGLGGVIITLMSLPFILRGLYTYDDRLSGIFLSPNHLAMALTPGIIAIAILLSSPKPPLLSSPRKRRSRKTLLILILTLELSTLYLTYSYGTWLGIIAAVMIILISKSRSPIKPISNEASKPKSQLEIGHWNFIGNWSWTLGLGNIKNKFLFHYLIVILSILVLLGLSQLSNPKLQHIVNGDYYSSLHSRIMIWQSALLISRDYWLAGVGAGNFQQAYLDYQKYFPEPYIEWAVPMPHNIFLAFQTQLGIVGLFSFIMIIVLTLFRLTTYDLRLTTKNPLNIWALAYLVYIIVHGMIDTPYWKNDLAIIFWLALAAVWANKTPLKRGGRHSDRGV